MSEEQAEYTTTSSTIAEKPLRCPECRRVMGHVRRVNGIRTFRMKLGRRVVEVTMDARVWCECGGMLHWHAGQEAIDELMEKVRSSGKES